MIRAAVAVAVAAASAVVPTAVADQILRPIIDSTVEVLVGVIGRAHGVRGDVVVQVRTDEPELRYAVGSRLRVEDSPRVLTVAARRFQGGHLVVRFEELGDRDAAEAARGLRLVTDVAPDARPAEADEYYDRQLVGLRTFSADGTEVGPVRSVLHLPAQDVLEIETDAGTRLVPFVQALVPEVDLASGTIRLADVPGLLDDPSGV